ncbi:MAG: tRNA (adenine-N1)-methyltransferase [Methanobacteriota archaeon]|nr:MAG: tRNA (adenine-N1)-methyltransferase [Euryarchaeota archaeon]
MTGLIKEGASVLLVDDRGGRHLLEAERNMIEVRTLGVVDGSAICESSYGDNISVGTGTLLIVKPSISDFLAAIERKAQIVTPKDGFTIPHYVDIACGSIVIEGGVGSGALTIVLLKSVAPNGRVYSYELRKDHASVAKRNVRKTGLQEYWELSIDDICTAETVKDADAAVLDMPNPWDAVANMHRAIRHGGHICCYVSNANQLESTVKAMRDAGFRELFAIENLQREMIVHEFGVRPSSKMMGHTGYLAFGRKL